MLSSTSPLVGWISPPARVLPIESCPPSGRVTRAGTVEGKVQVVCPPHTHTHPKAYRCGQLGKGLAPDIRGRAPPPPVFAFTFYPVLRTVLGGGRTPTSATAGRTRVFFSDAEAKRGEPGQKTEASSATRKRTKCEAPVANSSRDGSRAHRKK